MNISQYTIRLGFLFEVLAWLMALLMLALMNPEGEHLFSFCPYSWLWEEGCMGCGLGHGISFILRGDLQASWESHIAALPALLLIIRRIWQLLYLQYKHIHSLTLYK